MNIWHQSSELRGETEVIAINIFKALMGIAMRSLEQTPFLRIPIPTVLRDHELHLSPLHKYDVILVAVNGCHFNFQLNNAGFLQCSVLIPT